MKEQNLIFLISQPRSGSTLLQRILGAHSEIYTRSEPWTMFPFVYSLKNSGIKAQYDYDAFFIAFDDFINNLPSGKIYYINAIRDLLLKLYGDYLSFSKKQYFLDKTPRYYLVFDEILTLFPNAKYILLVRNPLDVFHSILKTWVKKDYGVLSKVEVDLFSAIDYILKIKHSNRKNLIIVHYEDMIKNKDAAINNIYEFLDIDYENTIDCYYKTNERMLYGDPKNVYEFRGIQENNQHKWINSLGDSDYWTFFYEYLNHIGKTNFEDLGYNYDESLEVLLENKPLHQSNISLFDYIGLS